MGYLGIRVLTDLDIPSLSLKEMSNGQVYLSLLLQGEFFKAVRLDGNTSLESVDRKECSRKQPWGWSNEGGWMRSQGGCGITKPRQGSMWR